MKLFSGNSIAVGNITISSKVRKRTLWMRRILITFLFFGLYSGFFYLMGNQWGGAYRCDSVYVQFGDAFGAERKYKLVEASQEENTAMSYSSFL
jgi:hypothetical protein